MKGPALKIAPPAEPRHPLGHSWLVMELEADLRVYMPTYLYRAYWRDMRTGAEIAKDLGCCPATVHRWLRLLGYDIRTLAFQRAEELGEPG